MTACADDGIVDESKQRRKKASGERIEKCEESVLTGISRSGWWVISGVARFNNGDRRFAYRRHEDIHKSYILIRKVGCQHGDVRRHVVVRTNRIQRIWKAFNKICNATFAAHHKGSAAAFMNMNPSSGTSFARTEHHEDVLVSDYLVYNLYSILQREQPTSRNRTVDGCRPVGPVNTCGIRVGLVKVALNGVDNTCDAIYGNLLLISEPVNGALLTLGKIGDFGHRGSNYSNPMMTNEIAEYEDDSCECKEMKQKR